MVEEHNADETRETENTPSISRRSFVKAGGATTLGLTGFGVGSTAASSTKNDVDIDIRQVNGVKKRRSIAVAQRSSEFKKLKKYLNVEKGEVIDSTSAEVAETTDDSGDPYTVVSFSKDKQQQNGTKADITFNLRNEKVLTARGTRTIFKGDKPETVQVFSIQSGQVIENSGDVWDENNISPRITKCGFCMELEKAACAIGCSVGLGFICGTMSLAPPAGVTCSVVGAAICYVLGRSGGCDMASQHNCWRAGQCSSPH